MRNRRLIVLLFALMLTIYAAILFWPSREPTCYDRTVTEWLIALGKNEAGSDGPIAIQHFGTNAIPYMLEGIRYQTPSYWYSSNALARAIRAIKFIRGPIEQKEARRVGALKAFHILGPRAESALPELNRMLYTYKPAAAPGSLFPLFVSALPTIGPKSLPFLMAALTNDHCQCRYAVAFVFLDLGTNAAPAVPLLVKCLEDKTEVMRWSAAWSLGRLKLQPEVVIPALLPHLQDTNPIVSRFASNAVTYWGPRAKPVLLKTLTNADPQLRSLATNALLDPNARPKEIF